MISVDGNWGQWGGWSMCTKTCKQGKQSRTRECNSPAPQHGGRKCDGEAQESQVCNQNVPCPSEFGFTIYLSLFFSFAKLEINFRCRVFRASRIIFRVTWHVEKYYIST